ncbi:NUDIX hydrolase [Haladaptatus sp. R4]|uniref:NUDIX domain-containing protein n=1 Tax=Haladaptatus sp. R4 TaxID=1679489 RepID=UPI0007B49883|nr:NUDIX domain-containing protein [Haladaptatus sp. R4]KZN24999.1 NUDIX hydrolase [Haladaptatus sp. R4]
MVNRPPNNCPYCGTELTTTEIEGRQRHLCPDCDRAVWHNPVPCAGVAVVDDDSVLIVKRAADPGRGEWTIPGGHLEVGEPPAAGAARELHEETGLSVTPDDLSLLDARSFGPYRGKYVVSIGYVVRREKTDGEVVAGSDADEARFITPDEFERTGAPFRENQRERFETAAGILDW